MYTNLGAWALVIWIIRLTAPTGAMKWYNEEQFVDGEFPYYPFSNKIYSLSDGLTDDEALANEFSAVNPDKKLDVRDQKATEFPAGRKRSILDRSQKSTFYEFKNASDTVIDATKLGVNEKVSKSVESRKRLGKIGRLVLKNTNRSPRKTKIDNGVPRVPRSSLKREDVAKPEIQIGFEEQKTQFLDDELYPQPAELFADGILQNLSGVVTPESKSNVVRSYSDALENWTGYKPEDNHNLRPTHAPVKINGPYENNFSGGGFRYTNPSTWLAREIEKFVRRKDYRWLDFMKNNGLETNGIMVETKHQPDEMRKLQKNRVIGCLQRTEEMVKQIPRKSDSDQPQETLLHQIDALLEDLSQFRASVENEQPGVKKTRGVKNARDRLLSRGKCCEIRILFFHSFVFDLVELRIISLFGDYRIVQDGKWKDTQPYCIGSRCSYTLEVRDKCQLGMCFNYEYKACLPPVYVGIIRETRSVTLPSFRGKSDLPKPILSHPRSSSSLVLDDLRDLKKNIVLYENNVPDEENRQALKDLRLHIKVYVENGEKGSNEEK